jgi:hypothetical protein
MSYDNYVIDATMGVRNGMFCFCPVELNNKGEITRVITGLTYLGTVPKGKIVAIVHEDGQGAVEAFCSQFEDELAELSKATKSEDAA